MIKEAKVGIKAAENVIKKKLRQIGNETKSKMVKDFLK